MRAGLGGASHAGQLALRRDLTRCVRSARVAGLDVEDSRCRWIPVALPRTVSSRCSCTSRRVGFRRFQWTEAGLLFAGTILIGGLTIARVARRPD